MSRQFSGILGLVAFVVSLISGWMMGGDTASVIATALWRLAIFAVIGSVLGMLAAYTIDDSVRTQVRNEIAERTSTNPKPDAAQRAPNRRAA